MKFLKFVSALLALALFAVTAPAALQAQSQPEDYRIQPGDTLRVEVLQDASLNRDVLVAPDGRISVPLAGVLRVGRTTLDEAQQRIREALAANFATPPNVLVSLLRLAEEEPLLPEEEEALEEEEEPLRIYVMGEVRSPGLQGGLPGSTLLQALAQAGGPTDFAATKRIMLRRTDPATGTETVYSFNYDQVLEGVAGVGTLELADGDVIVVPARRLFE